MAARYTDDLRNTSQDEHDGNAPGRAYDEGVDEVVRKQISRILRAAREQTRGSTVAGNRMSVEALEADSGDSGTLPGLVAR